MKTQNKTEPWKHVPKSAETRAKMSAARQGNQNAAKPKELHRVMLTATVAPETLAALRELSAARSLSIGKLIDAAVKLL